MLVIVDSILCICLVLRLILVKLSINIDCDIVDIKKIEIGSFNFFIILCLKINLILVVFI